MKLLPNVGGCNTILISVVLCIVSAPLCVDAQPPEISIGVALPREPEARSPLLLKATSDSANERNAFLFEGALSPPVIRSARGSQIKIDYLNQMSSHSKEICVDGPCRNMTNLHFHGLHVSPAAPQDDVITMMAMPGDTLHYIVDIPANQPPGLYWYHTHPHGESYQQALDGMSGAIVIEGIEQYVPEVATMTERILVLRDFDLSRAPSSAERIRKAVGATTNPCGEAPGELERVFTVNGVIRPKISIAAGESQFWRIVNASPDLYADLEVDSSTMKIVAIDGMPLAFHDPARHSEVVQHVLVAPAGRVEAIVTAPQNAGASLRTRCIDTGPDGDPNPAMVIADLDEGATPHAAPKAIHPQQLRLADSYPISKHILGAIEKEEPAFVVKFTEDKQGFYINDKKYGPDDPPMTVVKVGHYAHWRVTNDSGEIHPFHIHQVHFLNYANNGRQIDDPVWMDTVNVPSHGSVDLVMDFTDPIIRGMSLFHCHLLKHEDKGMMAKILFQ
jgi:suppressor of ftsI